MNYDYYLNVYKGKISKVEFEELLPKVESFLLEYIAGLLLPWNQRNSLEEYEINFENSICSEIDCIASNGGVSIFNGSIEKVNSVSTEGFNFSVDESSIEFYRGIPISPYTSSYTQSQLRRKGYFNLAL